MEEPAAKELLDLPLELISQILATNPTSSIKFIKIKHAIYAYWRVFRNVQDSLKDTNWKKEMGRVRDQGICETCWAVVAAELVSALLFIKKVNSKYIEYSAQDILDFADQDKAKKCKRHNHYCYTLSIRRALLYVLREGLQKEEHRPYKRCRHISEILARVPQELAHIDGVEKLSFDEALIKLESQPIGASLHIFMPDYILAKKGIYRGPMCANSSFGGMHAVSVFAVGEENGEKFFWVKSTHGEGVVNDGYLKVSMEIMLAQIDKDDTPNVPGMVLDDKFVKPKPLIIDFCCPVLHEEGNPMKCD